MDNTPLDQDPWLRSINKELLEYDPCPILGPRPPFPWDKLSEQFTAGIKLSSPVTFSADTHQWLSSENFSDGLGAPLRVITACASPLAGNAHLLISEADFSKVLSWALNHPPDTIALSDPDILAGIEKFLCLHSLHSINTVSPFKNVSLNYKGSLPLPESPALSLNITLSFKGERACARLLIDTDLQQSWQKTMEQEHSDAHYLSLATTMNVTMSISAGHVNLDKATLSSLDSGDFILLDHCSIDPTTKTGPVTVKVNNRPYFSAQLNQDGNAEITGLAKQTHIA